MPSRRLKLPIRTMDAWNAILERKAQETRVISSVDDFLERSLPKIQRAFSQGVSYEEMVADLHELGYTEITVDDLRTWVSRAATRRERSSPASRPRTRNAHPASPTTGKTATAAAASTATAGGKTSTPAAPAAASNGRKGPPGTGTTLGALDMETVDQRDANAVGAAIGS